MTSLDSHLTDYLANLNLNLPQPQADLYAIGVGITGLEQITLEALIALKLSKKIFGFSDVAWLKPFVNNLGAEFIQLDYPPIEIRSEIFRGAAKTITQATLNSPPVSWLSCGSPVRHVWLTHLLHAWTEREGIGFKIIHAPSSLDVILEHLKIDDSEGLQLYDSTFLIIHKLQLNPYVHCLIYNIEKTGIERSSQATYPRDTMLISLKEHLLKVYPPTHIISFIIIGTSTISSSFIQIQLSNLEEVVIHKNLGTLWIPPIKNLTLSENQTGRLLSLTELVRVAHTPCDRILGATAKKLSNFLKSRI